MRRHLLSTQTGFVRQLWLGASAVVLLGFGLALGLLTMSLDQRVGERHEEALALSTAALEVSLASSTLHAWSAQRIRDAVALDAAVVAESRPLVEVIKSKLAALETIAGDPVASSRRALDEFGSVLQRDASSAAASSSGRDALVDVRRQLNTVESQLATVSSAAFARMRALREEADVLSARKRVSRAAFAAVTILATVLLIAMTIRTMRSNNLVLDRLAQLAQEDALTGITNRRGLDEMLPVEFARAKRGGQPLAFVMMDLDLFKKYNDRRGHAAGDALLRGAAQAWARQLRPTDLLARYGGEEFTLVLPSCDADQAALLVDRLRVLVPDHQTFSAGIATWDGDESAAELLQRADQALLQAKKAGRNRTMIAGREPQTTLPLQMA